MDLPYASPDQLEPFDEIIDVRSPGEYWLDHIPGALNLPVLDDFQRAHIGLLYKQSSPFEAKKQGAALISAAIAEHLQQHFAGKPKRYRPVLYCWRGGQRSQSMAVILRAIGWYPMLIKGGYKAYRRQVIADIQNFSARLEVRLISGLTGVGKTRLLAYLAREGAQVLDLEALAAHRGSLLGATELPQPSQKRFESLLCAAVKGMDYGKPLYIEAESRKIGQLFIPEALWARMRIAKAIEIRASVETRVAILLEEYQHLCDQKAVRDALISKLKYHHGKAKVAEWLALSQAGQMFCLIERLLTEHYDPMYKYAQSRSLRRTKCLQLKGNSEENCSVLARQVLDLE